MVQEHAPGVTIRGVLAVVMDCPRLSHLRWAASRDSEDLVDDLETIRDVLAPKRFHLPRWPGRRKSKTDVADAEVAIAVGFAKGAPQTDAIDRQGRERPRAVDPPPAGAVDIGPYQTQR